MNSLQFFIHDDPDPARLEDAGSRAGADVDTLHQTWLRDTFAEASRPVIVDITSVTSVDPLGLALLALMHGFGAHIIAKSPESHLRLPIGPGARKMRQSAMSEESRTCFARS